MASDGCNGGSPLNRNGGEVRRSGYDCLAGAAGYALAAAYLACFTALAWRLHARFLTHALDLGYFDQIVWSAAHGQGFANTLKYPWNFMGDHLSPILYLLAPLYRLWPDVRVLLVVQTAALALAGLPIFWLARARDRALAPLALLAFYLNPALHLVNLSDFHEIALSTPFVSLAVWAVVRRRYPVVAGALLLALLCKEDVAILTFAFGVYLLAIDRRARGWGLGIAAFSVGWLLLALQVVIPAFREEGEYASIGARYGYLGSSAGEALRTVLTRPGVPLGHLARPEIAAAFLRQVLPTGFTALLGWPLFALSLPVFLYLQLSDQPSLYTLQEWHVAPLLPILFAAAVGTWGLGAGRWRYPLALAMVLGSCYALFAYSPALPALRAEGTAPRRGAQIEAIADRLAPDSTVSAQSDIVPHVSQRARVFAFPSVIGDADDIVLDRQGNRYPIEEHYDSIVNDEALARPDFRAAYDRDGLLWLRKETDVPGPNVVFGGTFRLVRAAISVEDMEGFFPATLRAGSAVTVPGGRRVQVNLYWQRLAQAESDCKVSVELVDETGRVLASYEGPAVPGSRSMEHLETAPVHGTQYLTVPEGAQGPAEIRVGLYRPENGQRLTTAGGQEHAIVAALRLGP